MPTRARALRSRRRLLPLTVFIAAAIGLLAFAAYASAETKIGEYSAPLDPTIPAEASILHASTEYQAAGGALSMTVTTAAEPQAEVGGEVSGIQMVAGIVNLPECTQSSFESIGKGGVGYPVFEILARYSEPTLAAFATLESEKEAPKFLPAGREGEGPKTILSAQTPKAANRPYNCGVVALEGVENEANEEVKDVAIFPLTVKPEPPAAETKPAPAAPEARPAAAAPAPAAAALSIAKARRPLSLKVGKWATARVKVTNTGGTATGPGALRVKAPAGVLVKPERQKVPILAPGGSWTISVRVQLTARAKARTTLALTGTAPGLTAKGSLVLRSLGA